MNDLILKALNTETSSLISNITVSSKKFLFGIRSSPGIIAVHRDVLWLYSLLFS